MNIYEAIRHRLLAEPGKTILDAGDRRMTGADLDILSCRYAAALLSEGVAQGDRVAVQVEKSPDAVALYLGCLRVGAVYLPLNTGYGEREITYFIEDAQPRVFVVSPEAMEGAQTLLSDLPDPPVIMTLGAHGDGSLADRVSEMEPEDSIVPRSAEDLAAICYTSGTTGRAKGAMITHGNLLSNATALIDIWGFSESDVLLHALPIYHVHGLFVALHCALLSGASLIFQPRFDAKAAVKALGQATVMMGVPTFYTRLLLESDFTRTSCVNVRLFISGSAPLLPDTFEAFAQRTGQRILERYGMTETGMICSNRRDRERRPGVVGWPLPGVEIRLAGEEGSPEAPAGIGIVEVRGPNVFAGYWRQPEKTQAEFRGDSFFITGDLGSIDPDGALRLVGRAKDLIISGGLNVYPKEIEELIDALPGVDETAVIGLPHADLGEAVVAVVKPRAGAFPSEADVISALKGQIAGFKVPKRVVTLDELPRNTMGKVQKNLLRGRFADLFAERATGHQKI